MFVENLTTAPFDEDGDGEGGGDDGAGDDGNLKKDKRVFFFILVLYELRKLGERAHLKLIGCFQH